MLNKSGLLALCLLMAAGARAAPSSNADIAKLQGDVARLTTQQQQILDSLDELKRLLKGRTRSRTSRFAANDLVVT